MSVTSGKVELLLLLHMCSASLRQMPPQTSTPCCRSADIVYILGGARPSAYLATGDGRVMRICRGVPGSVEDKGDYGTVVTTSSLVSRWWSVRGLAGTMNNGF